MPAHEEGEPQKLDPSVKDALLTEGELSGLKSALDIEAQELVKAANSAAVAYGQRYRFSLAVANGAGVVFIGAVLTSDKSVLQWWNVLPSAWCFAGGALASGLMFWFANVAHTARGERWTMHRLAPMMRKIDAAREALIEAGVEYTGKATEIDETLAKLAVRSQRCERASNFLEFVAATAFAAGALYPIIILTRRAMAA